MVLPLMGCPGKKPLIYILSPWNKDPTAWDSVVGSNLMFKDEAVTNPTQGVTIGPIGLGVELTCPAAVL